MWSLNKVISAQSVFSFKLLFLLNILLKNILDATEIFIGAAFAFWLYEFIELISILRTQHSGLFITPVVGTGTHVTSAMSPLHHWKIGWFKLEKLPEHTAWLWTG